MTNSNPHPAASRDSGETLLVRTDEGPTPPKVDDVPPSWVYVDPVSGTRHVLPEEIAQRIFRFQDDFFGVAERSGLKPRTLPEIEVDGWGVSFGWDGKITLKSAPTPPVEMVRVAITTENPALVRDALRVALVGVDHSFYGHLTAQFRHRGPWHSERIKVTSPMFRAFVAALAGNGVLFQVVSAD